MYHLRPADLTRLVGLAGLLRVRVRVGDRGCPVIDPTDEMMERAWLAMFGERPPNPILRKHLRDAAVAVLAIVERDRDARYVRLLEANRKLVDRLHELERIEDKRDKALGQLEDARRELARRK